MEVSIKMYGFSKILEFPCICYGIKGYFFKIKWSPIKHKFCVYKGHTTVEDIYLMRDGKLDFIGILKIKQIL